MRLKTHELSLDSLLRQCYTKKACTVLPRHRHFSTPTQPSSDAITDVAVLGGGITGLASAYFLTKSLPRAKITIYDSSTRLGGWLHSRYVDVGNGKILFEHGPRTLRPGFPGAAVTAMLIQELDMIDDVLCTPGDAPAALNRFIYYPDHLVRMPSPGMTFWEGFTALRTEPLFSGLLWKILGEGFRPKRPATVEDESVGDFVSRRFGRDIANNIASAVLHGVYAGNVWQLSARSILPKMWMCELQSSSLTNHYLEVLLGEGPLLNAYDLDMVKRIQDYPWDPEWRKALKDASVFTFKKGVGQLAERLEEQLRASDNITIRTNTQVQSISAVENGIEVRAAASEGESWQWKHDHVLSTLASSTLCALTSRSKTLLPSLASAQAVTVMVVNLYFSQPDLLPVQGFGYLIPNSVPFEQNPEFALGVVFDSDAIPAGQDTMHSAPGPAMHGAAPRGTKVTVMLGGHWWNDWDAYPSEDEGAVMARTVLARHLRITAEAAAVHVSLQRNCIPQYTVGYNSRMRNAHEELRTAFGGRLRVAGSWYGTGVGVNDCLRAASEVVRRLVEDPKRGTGLEALLKSEQWGRVVEREQKVETQGTR